MTDPWSSAEAMLSWQIALARRRIEEIRAKLPKDGILYPLPKSKPGKPPKGTPGGWAFGNLSPHELGLQSCLSGLQWAENHLDRAEAALTGGDLAIAIYWVIQGNQSIHAATAAWHSHCAVAQHRYVGEVRRRQKKTAGRERKKEIAEIIRGLALRNFQGNFPTPKELWPEFLAALDDAGCDPKEIEDRVEYEGEKRRDKMAFRTFSNAIYRHRGTFLHNSRGIMQP